MGRTSVGGSFLSKDLLRPCSMRISPASIARSPSALPTTEIETVSATTKPSVLRARYLCSGIS